MRGRKSKTTEEYIAEAVSIWGDKYDYSKVIYTGCDNKIDIVCPIHGKFSIRATSHLLGYGCQKCSYLERRSFIHSIALNDVAESTLIDGKKDNPLYKTWLTMIDRTTGEINRRPQSYRDAIVCKEWLKYSSFLNWALNPESGYINGYELDKDIISPGNKAYSPQTCCFVPTRINLLFVLHHSQSGKPTGVCKSSNRYTSFIKLNDKITTASFAQLSEAMDDYVNKKTNIIRDVANEYYSRGEITKRVYDAMLAFPVREYLTNYNKFNV